MILNQTPVFLSDVVGFVGLVVFGAFLVGKRVVLVWFFVCLGFGFFRGVDSEGQRMTFSLSFPPAPPEIEIVLEDAHRLFIF